MTTGVWVAGGVTVALLVTGTITGIMALGANSDFEDSVTVVNDPASTAKQRHQAYADAEGSADKAEALALTTDILLIGAVVGAGLTTWLWLSSDSGGESAARLKVQPSLARRAGGLVLSSAF